MSFFDNEFNNKLGVKGKLLINCMNNLAFTSIKSELINLIGNLT